jgi:16S rRNA (guanine527-N7)-methyltransferase
MAGVQAVEFRAAARALGIDVDEDAVARVLRHVDLLDVWNKRFHLTGERDRATLLLKHAVDSLAPVPWIPTYPGLVVDIGTGAGFPGVILACVRPDIQIALIEPRRRPCSFLAESIRSIPLPRARVMEARAEDLPTELRGAADVVVSRALKLETFLRLAAPLLRPDGSAIAMQTPQTVVPVSPGLRLAETHDYELPDGGERRRLLRFVRV